MDYIPVYEGEDSDDDSVKLSPGKIQRTGVKSEPAAPRTIRSMIHAPGVIQLDERRISVIAMRAESYIQKVENVTIGTHVVKGQPLMEVYSPAVSSAAAEYISTINSKTTAGDGLYGRGSRQRLMNLDVPDAAIVDDGEEPAGADRDRVDLAARRRRARAQRHRGHARATGRRAVPDCRPCAGLGRHRRRRARSRRAGDRTTRDRQGPWLSRPRFHRQNRRHLSRDQQGDAHRAAADRTRPIRISRCCTACMSTPKSTSAAPRRC